MVRAPLLVVGVATLLACRSPSSPRAVAAPTPVDAGAIDPAAMRYADQLVGPAEGDVPRRRKPGEALPDVAAAGQPTPAPPPSPARPAPASVLVEIAAEAFDESSLTGDVAASEVRDRFQARLVACFRRGLAAGAAPTAAIALSLTVGETGAVTSPRATPSGELGDCVMASARVWRFDVPRDADGEPTETSLRFSITFTPGP